MEDGTRVIITLNSGYSEERMIWNKSNDWSAPFARFYGAGVLLNEIKEAPIDMIIPWTSIELIETLPE